MKLIPEYGDNIFEIAGVTANTLKAAGWPRPKIDAMWKEVLAAPSYDEAVGICRRFITIREPS